MNATDVLQTMPTDLDSLLAYFDAMDGEKFDAVCVASIVELIEDNFTETNELDGRTLALSLVAMRDRYRRMIQQAKHANPTREMGARHHSATMNECQARIIRRIPKGKRGGPHGLGCTSLSRMFGVSRIAIEKLRQGKTWKHLANAKMPLHQCGGKP